MNKRQKKKNRKKFFEGMFKNIFIILLNIKIMNIVSKSFAKKENYKSGGVLAEIIEMPKTKGELNINDIVIKSSEKLDIMFNGDEIMEVLNGKI